MPTIADLIVAVTRCDASPKRREEECSALRTLARLLGKPPEDIVADPKSLKRRMKALSPLAVGMSVGRWNNIGSLVRSALGRVAPIMPGCSQEAMSPEWAQLQARVGTDSDRYRLSRLLRWLSGKAITPASVRLADLLAFRDTFAENGFMADPAKSWRLTSEVWNRSVERVPGWPSIVVERAPRPDVFTFSWSHFPASLEADVRLWLRRLAGTDLRDDGPNRPSQPGTLATREYQLRAFASALVRMGRAPEALTCLADLVSKENYIDGLRFWHQRKGNKSSSALYEMASMLKGVAKYRLSVDPARLLEMGRTVEHLFVKQNGLAAKNRSRLRQIDDPEKVDRLLRLPFVLKYKADSRKLRPKRAAMLAQMAVAIELLFMTAIRRENLAAIEIDRHLIQAGRKRLLVIPEEEVKNQNELEFELPHSTIELLDWYVEHHRPQLASKGSNALFPGRTDAKKGDTLGRQLCKVVFDHTGLTVNTHLFRHIGAKIYLNEKPGGIEVVRRTLGHKNVQTALDHYVGHDNRAATREFDKTIIERRERALASAPPPRRGSTKAQRILA